MSTQESSFSTFPSGISFGWTGLCLGRDDSSMASLDLSSILEQNHHHSPFSRHSAFALRFALGELAFCFSDLFCTL